MSARAGVLVLFTFKVHFIDFEILLNACVCVRACVRARALAMRYSQHPKESLIIIWDAVFTAAKRITSRGQ